MTRIAALGTYLPVWGTPRQRRIGSDEDAITLAVAAGRAALADPPVDTSVETSVNTVVLVTRDLPLVEGGVAAALLAGLGLPADREVIERNGGAPATLDALTQAPAGTLVIGVDLDPAGAAAALVTADSTGLEVRAGRRVTRSLPVRARGGDGVVHDYDDPRLLRERGLNASLEYLQLAEPPVAVTGTSAADGKRVSRGAAVDVPTSGASAPLFALAALPAGTAGTILGVDQATVGTAELTGHGGATVRRDELPARPVPATRPSDGPPIPISLPAYDRAFLAKLTFQAGRGADGVLTFPPRRSAETGEVPDLVPLPRRGEVYTMTTINVPVPGMATPYSLVMVELDDVGVRVLCRTTACAADEVAIGDSGQMVFRRVAVRSGVPDYSYAFRPDSAATTLATTGAGDRS
jgi:uncharacterized OB-fold protein